MSAKTDVNRRVLAIQAKKKRHKPSKRKGKASFQEPIFQQNAPMSKDKQDAHSSKGPRDQVAASTVPDYSAMNAQRFYLSDNGNR